jgi:hypothetical protein
MAGQLDNAGVDGVIGSVLDSLARTLKVLEEDSLICGGRCTHVVLVADILAARCGTEWVPLQCGPANLSPSIRWGGVRHGYYCVV